MPSVSLTGIALAGSLGSSIIQSNAASSAADAQTAAANQANALQTRIYDETTARNKPYYDTGTSALAQLAGAYGLNGATSPTADGSAGTPSANAFASFYQSPDYQFQFGQGIRGVDAGASARHMLDSGATRKAEIGYAGNLASGQFNTYANRLQALAGIGQGAANNTAAAGQGYANAYGNNISNAAAAQGNAALANGSIWGNTLGNLTGQLTSSYGGSSNPGGLLGRLLNGGGSSLAGQSTGAEFGWT